MNSGMHLKDEQIASFVVEADPQSAVHLRECARCNAKVENLKASLSGFGAHFREVEERPNSYWWRQRSAQPRNTFSRARWGTAAAAVLLTFALWLPFIHKTAQTRTPAPVAIQQISDEALLSEVQADVQREYPDALAPVQANAESAVAAQAFRQAHKKEYKRK